MLFSILKNDQSIVCNIFLFVTIPYFLYISRQQFVFLITIQILYQRLIIIVDISCKHDIHDITFKYTNLSNTGIDNLYTECDIECGSLMSVFQNGAEMVIQQ